MGLLADSPSLCILRLASCVLRLPPALTAAYASLAALPPNHLSDLSSSSLFSSLIHQSSSSASCHSLKGCLTRSSFPTYLTTSHSFVHFLDSASSTFPFYSVQTSPEFFQPGPLLRPLTLGLGLLTCCRTIQLLSCHRTRWIQVAWQLKSTRPETVEVGRKLCLQHELGRKIYNLDT